MGITINDTLNLNIGIAKASTYASYGNSTLRINKDTTTSNYNVECIACIWADYTSRTDGKPFIEQINTTVGITSGQLLTDNVYTILYDDLKTSYTSTTDVLE